MQMETLPPKYLKPIFVTGKTINIPSSSPLYQKYISMVQTVAGAAVTTSTEAFTTGTETFSAGAESYSAGAEAFTAGAESYAAEGGAEAFTAGAESYAAEGGAEAFTAGAESYAAEGGAEFGGDFTAGAEFGAGAEAGAEFGGEAFTGGEEFGAGAEAGAEFGGFEGAGASAGGDLSGYQLIRRGNGITQNEENKIAQAAASVVQQGLTPLSNQTARAVKKVLGGDWLVIVYPQDKPIDFNMTCVQGNDYMYFTLNGNAYQVCRLV
jgi:hypothetical protein